MTVRQARPAATAARIRAGEVRLAALALVTLLVFYGCWLVARPFFGSLAWATVLALVTRPVFDWIAARVPHRRSLAAGLAVAVVTLGLVLPVVGVAAAVVREVRKGTETLNADEVRERWDGIKASKPRLRPVLERLERYVLGLAGAGAAAAAPGPRRSPAQAASPPPRDEASPASPREGASPSPGASASASPAASASPSPAGSSSPSPSGSSSPSPRAESSSPPPEGEGGGGRGVVSSTVRGAMEFLITLFALFFFFRDGAKVKGAVRDFMPMTRRRADRVLRRLADTVWATTYGTLVVAAVQGTLGGLMFWWLGLPAPILWGVVMAMLALIPVLGAFVVWVPAAAFLALEGSWGKAAILVAWGAVVIGTIDNLLYPSLVGKRLRLHTLVVFMAMVGGLSVFGAAGLFVGPVLVSLGLELRRIWRAQQRRAAAQRA